MKDEIITRKVCTIHSTDLNKFKILYETAVNITTCMEEFVEGSLKTTFQTLLGDERITLVYLCYIEWCENNDQAAVYKAAEQMVEDIKRNKCA